jgi:SRSO17 transposase
VIMPVCGKGKSGSAGAWHQYSGTVGGTAMCQVAVTLTWAAPAGHALIGRALYLPDGWAADEERRELAGVPGEIMFKTKPQLAGDLLQHAHDQGIRAGFVAGDGVCGGRDLRKSIRARGADYVLAVRSSYAVTLPSGRRRPAKTASNLVKPAMWQRMRTGSAEPGLTVKHEL